MDSKSFLYCGPNKDLHPSHKSGILSLEVDLARSSYDVKQLLSVVLFCLNNVQLMNLVIGAKRNEDLSQCLFVLCVCAK